jgi:hypothetical protein
MRDYLRLVMVAVVIMMAIGCAGLPAQDQQNMAANAGIWGGIGAGSGAAVAAATGHSAGPAAVIGGVVGALLGIGNTPRSVEVQRKCYYSPPPPQSPKYYDSSRYHEEYEEAYWRERDRLERQRQYEMRRHVRREAQRHAKIDDYFKKQCYYSPPSSTCYREEYEEVYWRERDRLERQREYEMRRHIRREAQGHARLDDYFGNR